MVIYSLKLSFSLLLWSAWSWCSPVHPDTLAYFSLLLWAIWGWCSPVHVNTVVLSYLQLSFPLLLWSAWSWCSPIHPDTLAYFSLLLWAIWGWCSPVHIDTVVFSYLKLSPSLFLWSAWSWCSPVHPDTLAYFSLLLWAIWGWCSPVHIDAVVFSGCLLSFLELSLARYDDELLLAVGAFYKSKGLRIDGNSCLCLLSPPAPAPHSKCLGQSVARFRRPFGSRLADPTRRERYLHLVAQPSISGVIPATAAIASTPRPLERAEGPSSAHRKGFQCRRRLKF